MNTETADAAQAHAESAFGQLGFSLVSELLPAVIAASGPADTPPVQARSRRERRERERAQAQHSAPASTAVSPPVFETQPLPVEAAAPAAVVMPATPELPVEAPVVRVDTVPAIAPVAVTTRRAALLAESQRRSRLQQAAAPAAPAGLVPRVPGVTVRKRVRRPFKRALLSKLMSVGAMVGAAAMMVATTVPANAFYSADTATHSPLSVTAPVQSLSVPTAAEPAATVGRDAYTVSSLADQIRVKFGSRSFSYTNDPNGTIQWPFTIPVPISSGFGRRIAPCGGCTSFHEGLDFVPGAGAPIQAIADGVVSLVSVSNSAYGNHVVIDHVINGQKVQTLYAHMKYGSIKVAEGQHVKVTDIIGLVGSTGESTGPHLHFEVHLGGVPVDPFAWLKANAN
ncbi:M23 family metallopeptidase [Parafrigoribacterium mesophilum]|uniref:M23 family metallopeptidase n=1 Tax=Parafrigoribacterium mesophilum TaxID=433646 RepID=UPI0031FC667B